jgi:hypothetical protein
MMTSKPRLLSREEWWYATEVGVCHHYDLSQSQSYFDIQTVWRKWSDYLKENFTGVDLYERHVNWYKMRYTKLGQALK